MLKRLILVLAGVAAGTLTVTCLGAGGPAPPPHMPESARAEEVIVKFNPGTPPHQVLLGALAEGPQADARLDDLAARLSGELGIPLRIERLTSGREFVLSLAADTMASMLVEHLRARSDVGSAHVLETGERTRLYRNPSVAVEIRPESDLGQSLAGPPEERARHLKGFAADVSRDIGFPVSMGASRPVEIVIDVSTVAAELVERLEQRPDVAYAQLDVRLQPLR